VARFPAGSGPVRRDPGEALLGKERQRLDDPHIGDAGRGRNSLQHEMIPLPVLDHRAEERPLGTSVRDKRAMNGAQGDLRERGDLPERVS